MSLNLATLIRTHAARDAARTALIAGNARLTYGDLDLRARRLAAGLARCGVRRGQHLALLLPNTPHFTIAYFAAHYLGAAVIPLNVLFKQDEIAYHLSDSDAVALIAWDDLMDQARAGMARSEACRTLIAAGSDARKPPPDGVPTMGSLIARGEAVDELPDTNPDDTAVILYTSGTTGRPKGAELTHFNLFSNAGIAARLTAMTRDTVALGALPLFHSFGQTVVQNAVLLQGGAIVLIPRFDPQIALAEMSRHRVTFFAGVPTMYFALLHYDKASDFDLSSLTYCNSGGAAMPVEVMKAFDARYGVEVLEGYGLSETSPVASFNVLDRPRKPGSIGLPVDGVEFRLVDDAGRVVTEAGVPGEIWIKGHNVMKGYYKRPEATAEAIREGWFASGDIAHRDEDGYYFIVDRKKDMIVRGGFNVYPREIEEILYGHPDVAEAAVVGVADERVGEEVKAFVVPRAGHRPTEASIIDYCRERLAAYKYPRLVEFREALPKGPTGKILKRALRG